MYCPPEIPASTARYNQGLFILLRGLVLNDHDGGKMISGAPNEVWSYGEEVYKICTRYKFCPSLLVAPVIEAG